MTTDAAFISTACSSSAVAAAALSHRDIDPSPQKTPISTDFT